MSVTALLERPQKGFLHEALLYRGAEDAVAKLAEFVRGGQEAGEPVLVALESQRWGLLREALGTAADGVTFVDMREAGRNPNRIISVWHDWLAGNPGRALRGVGEPVWAERSAAELAECAAHERLLNLACEGSLLWLVCPYDTAGLSAEALALAHQAHPHILAEDARRTNGPLGADWLELLAAPLDEPAAVEGDLEFADGPGQARHAAAAHAEAAGLPRHRVDDFVLAVSEAVTNSLRHGGGAGRMRMWRDNGAVVAEIRDSGTITDPLVGRTLPASEATNGRGLWIANQVCDLVQLRSGDHGTAVRLHVRA